MSAIAKALQFDARKTDYLNIGLIILSLVLAFNIPFELFLFAYAVLGPLHYLTEISWLRSKGYFVLPYKLMLGVAIFCAIFILPNYVVLQLYPDLVQNAALNAFFLFCSQWTNSIIFLIFVFALGLVFIKNQGYLKAYLALGVFMAYALKSVPLYNLVIGSFLPTLIHVYLFTVLFMLYGALRENSKAGMGGVLLALACPFIIFFMDVEPAGYILSDNLKQTFVDGNFHHIGAKMAGVLGISDGNGFYFMEKPYIKLQIFISFAYCYHYLNWFSKTSVIGWHKNLNPKKIAIITVVWAFAVFLYWYSYRLGFASLIFLSMLHLFLEFPLNAMSVKGIWGELRKRAIPKAG